MSTDIVLLTGPPGTGKTTTARALAARREHAVHLHTDDFFHAIISGGIAPHRPEAEAQNQTVMRVIREAAAGYAAGGFTTIVDGIMGPWMLPLLRPLTTLDGIRTHWIVLRADRLATVERAQARTGPRDLVDEEPTTAMWEQFADLGTWESHVIETGPHSPAQTLEAVDDAVLAGTHLLA